MSFPSTLVPSLLSPETLEATAVVANNTMNRERQLRGGNGYRRELGFDVVDFLCAAGEPPAWLDVCCGTGRALLEAESLLPPHAVLIGIDLVDRWWSPRDPASRVRLICAPIRAVTPDQRFDLVTVVHGLHYTADKLGTLLQLRSWLMPAGRLVAHLDLDHVRLDGQPASPALLRALGFSWNPRAHRVSAIGPPTLATTPPERLPVFLGSAPAGPTFTRQPGVACYYRSP